ncbi:MAG: Argininosuccinate lyase [Verrucomicrobia subdivision 3 bacterium]|nr:Argininosuccinate lyase [Limisphaerales bacterium]MCS1414864.1 Argininosuccinate lyase [Limisphaerales bacterium]
MEKASQVSRSGRFSQTTAEDLIDFSESISFDWRLWRQDIVGSMAHARMLQKIGVLTKKNLTDILKGLEEIGDEIERGDFQWDRNLEDVHMNIESALTARVPAGAKIHTARSRNDQIALDMRMWLRDETVAVIAEIRELQSQLVQLGKRSFPTPIPGYTHLQRAQPVPFAHHLLAYTEMLDRDTARFADSFNRLNVCPLGSGALAGSTVRSKREIVAKELGFVDADGNPRISQNSMDAVSDRDFIVEFLSTAALTAVHLSRLSEDIILWSSAEFGFITIDDAYTTGSSLMPQKKNPDLAELTRGKSGRVIGNLVSILTLLKGLPMTYNRDLQEDKERLFDTADTIRASLRITAAMLAHTNINAEVCQAAAEDPSLLATDLADYLVKLGIPFREAHHIVGAVVALAEEKKRALNKLTLGDLKSVDSRFKRDALTVFSLIRGLQERKTPGSPGLQEVKRQLKEWRTRLSHEQNSTADN